MAPAYRRVGAQNRPILVIWGRDDKTVPFTLSKQALAVMPDAEFHPIDGAGHVPHLEQPELVNPLLIDFITRNR